MPCALPRCRIHRDRRDVLARFQFPGQPRKTAQGFGHLRTSADAGDHHIHTSLMMVDVVVTGISGRAKMAEALRGFAGLPRKLEASEELSPIAVNAAAG